jgi:hypothetical protein
LRAALGHLGGSLASLGESSASNLRAAWRREVRRTSAALAFALATAFFVCAAAGFALFSFMLAFWDTHRVLAATVGAAGSAVLALIAALLLWGCTRTNSR